MFSFSGCHSSLVFNLDLKEILYFMENEKETILVRGTAEIKNLANQFIDKSLIAEFFPGEELSLVRTNSDQSILVEFKVPLLVNNCQRANLLDNYFYFEMYYCDDVYELWLNLNQTRHQSFIEKMNTQFQHPLTFEDLSLTINLKNFTTTNRFIKASGVFMNNIPYFYPNYYLLEANTELQIKAADVLIAYILTFNEVLFATIIDLAELITNDPFS